MPSLQIPVDLSRQEQPPARRRSARTRLSQLLATPHLLESATVLSIPIFTVAALAWHRRWMSDDGFINVRVVENLFAGHGPVFNVGERVEVGTSTLWLVLLSLGHAVTPFLAISRVAVYGGLLATVLGLVAVTVGASVLWRRLGRGGPFLPLGTVVLAALPPFWDFATSGLETGLAFLWLGGSFLLLALRLASVPPRGGERRPAWQPLWPALVIGLGPLVRPDLTLIAAALGLALLAQSRRSWTSWAGAAAVAFALPGLYEVLRAGYYATLVPNTALAKGAGSSMWAEGLRYVADFAGLYVLALPLLVTALILGAPALAATLRRRDLAAAALLAAPVLGGVLHALFVIRVGGDFMHGRFLLPATFSILMPVAVVATGSVLRERLQVLVPLLVVVPWAVVVAAEVRPDYSGVGAGGIADERSFYSTYSGKPNPVLIGDYELAAGGRGFHAQGVAARDRAARGERLLLDGGPQIVDEGGIQYPVADGYGLVVRTGNIGVFGVVAGPRVFVADGLSLASALGARLEVPLAADARIGHAQVVPLEWDLARYAQPSAQDPQPVQDARAALQCTDLARLDAAITAPMTPGRFLRNLRDAPSLTRLSIPLDPAEARATFCGPA